MKNRKRIIFMSISLLCLSGIFTWQSFYDSKPEEKDLPVYPMEASFVYDPANIRETVGIVDYVFVGKVLEREKTIYENEIEQEDEDGNTLKTGSPYTPYEVQVVKNIKGELQKEQAIPILKEGGIAMDQQGVILYEDDTLPKTGEEYIFLAYAQQDGSLLVSGPNSNINVKHNKSTLIKKYKDAEKNEIVPIVRKRFQSKYRKQ